MKRGNGITIGYLRDAVVDGGWPNPSKDRQETLRILGMAGAASPLRRTRPP